MFEAAIIALGGAALALALASLGNAMGWGKRLVFADQISLALIVAGCSFGGQVGVLSAHQLLGSLIGACAGMVLAMIVRRLAA